jgi:hypothetical protein
MSEKPLPKARSFPWFPWLLLALAGGGIGYVGWLLLQKPPGPLELGTVREIRITAKPGLDLTKLKENFWTPDYYLEIYTDLGHVQTPTIKSTPVGNGLTFKMPVPLRIADITEIRAKDENTLSKDTTVDRIDHLSSREVDGEKFHFQLLGFQPQPQHDKTLAWTLIIGGVALFLLSLLRFITAQVI